MGKKIKPLLDCKETDDYIRRAEGCGGFVKRQTGSHVIVEGPNGGTVVVPNKRGELQKGTRGSINRMFIALGMGVFLILCLVLAVPIL